MRGPILRNPYVYLLLSTWLVATMPQLANAATSNPLAASLASNLVQSRAQISIYRHDDQRDLDCQNRSFVKSKVVKQPRVVNQTLNERKWVEQWSLNRCGRQIDYHVYFTEVGDGGAFFSYREVDSVQSYLARTLRLRQPRMEGSDVRALQTALLDQGFDVGTDGIFGPNTRNILMAYQRKNNLTADGIAGPATFARLGL